MPTMRERIQWEIEGRISQAAYALTHGQRHGLSASEVRNVITDLLPTIAAEVERAVLAEREACAKVAEAALSEEGNAIARVIRHHE